MRIVIINQHMHDVLGGSEIQCDLLATGLVERGHDVLYVAPSNNRFDPLPHPYSITPVTKDPDSILAAIKEYQPDVVYWRYNLNSFRPVASGLARVGVPLVFAVSHVNDVSPWVWNAPNRTLMTRLRQMARRRWSRGGFRHVHALTTNNRDLLTLSPVANAYYVPNGMIAEAEPFHWPRPYIAWVANIKPAKRPEAFVEASRPLAQHGIDGLMVGHIQSYDYDWLSDPERTPDNFYYLGPRTLCEVNGLLAASRLQVHTCQPEGFPNIFIQTWMQGRPSVSLEYDPCGYITEQAIGFVAGGDRDAFTQAVVEWATQPAKAEAAGQRARAFAKASFSVKAMVNRVEHVLESTSQI